MEPKPDSRRSIKTLNTAFGIIEFLKDHREAGVSEIAGELDVANSTVHAHLSTMKQLGYVVKDGTKYQLSLRFLGLGNQIRKNCPLEPVAKVPLQTLAEETGEIAWLMTEQNGYAVHLRKAMGRSGIQTHGQIGSHPHMHYLAGGKAMLAFLPRSRVEEIIERRGLPAKTERTITDSDELFEELEVIRERGYAFNDEELERGLRCIGAPIIVQDSGVIGAISVCGPAKRLTEERYRTEIQEQLLGCTNEIELRITHTSD